MTENQRSRRDVLLAGVSGLAATLASRRSASGAELAAGSPHQSAESKTGPLPPVLKVNLAGYSFRSQLDKPGKPGKMSLFDLVELGARLGIDAIEPTSYYFLRTDDAFIYELKRKAFLAGLEISGTPIRNNFCQPPGPGLDKEIAHVRTWVDHCVKLGSPAIRVFAG